MGEPINIHIQSLINMIQENNRVITTKKGKGKQPSFCVNRERVITIYGEKDRLKGYLIEIQTSHTT